MKKDHIKTIGFSSDGTLVLFLQEEKKLIVFNSNNCNLIAGNVEDIYSWFTNTLKVFAPVEYNIEKGEIILDFLLERIMFKSKLSDLSKDFEEYKQQYEVVK